MERFGLAIHPLDARRNSARQYPVLPRALPVPLINILARWWSPLLLSHVVGVRSQGTGKEIEGWIVGCPLAAGQMLRLPPQVVYDKIVQTGRLAQRQGAEILGLGAFTSALRDGGVTIAQRLNMPVTTGNSLTVALAVAALEEAVEGSGRSGSILGARQSLLRSCSNGASAMARATVAIVGASGSIGLGCAEMLAPLAGKLLLVGRREIHLSRARALAEAAGAAGKVRISTRMEDVEEADVVLSAASAAQPFIQPGHLKKNAIVCDVAPLATVSPAVRRERTDVLLIDGGITRVPGHVDFGFDFGLPAGQAYAFMGEVMVLALEGRYESFSLGQRVQTERVREIAHLAHRHGFRLAPSGVLG